LKGSIERAATIAATDVCSTRTMTHSNPNKYRQDVGGVGQGVAKTSSEGRKLDRPEEESLLLLVNLSFLHHEPDMLELTNVGDRITAYRDDIGRFPWGYRTE
jgi:hypothetical protein